MKKTLSVIGAFLLLYIVTVNLSALACFYIARGAYYLFVQAGADAAADAVLYLLQGDGVTFFVLFINALAQYFIAMPLTAYLLRKAVSRVPLRPLPGVSPVNLDIRTDAADALMPDQQNRNDTSRSPLRFSSAIAVVSIIFFLMIAGSILGNITASIVEKMTGQGLSNLPVEILTSGSLLMTVIFVVLIAPIAEELFFRKLLIDLVRPISRRGAVMLSALCFALFHQNIYQFFYTLFIGFVFALIYENTRCIRHTILLHILVNLTGGILLPRASEVLNILNPDALFSLGDSAGATAVTVFLSTLFLFLFFALVLIGMIVMFVYIAQGKAVLTEQPGCAPWPEFLRAFFTAPGMLLYFIACVGLTIYGLFG